MCRGSIQDDGDVLIIISSSDTELAVISAPPALLLRPPAAPVHWPGSAASAVEINQIQFAAPVLFTVQLSCGSVFVFV